MATLTKEESKRGIRVSEMSPKLQGQVEKLGIDEDGDGKITGKEMGKFIDSYLDTKKDNKFLRHLVTVLVIFSFLLTGCVFGASITAARLSKDTAVDPVNGIMFAKDSDRPIQTEAVAIRNDGVIVNDMNTNELDALDEISLDNGSMKFQVKGYAKSVEKNQVALLVEGGSLIYGQEGLVAATGMAETMFNVVYPDDTVSVEEGVRRTQRVLGQATTSTVSGYPEMDYNIMHRGNGGLFYEDGMWSLCDGVNGEKNGGCTDLLEDSPTPSPPTMLPTIEAQLCDYNLPCEVQGLGRCFNKYTDEYLPGGKKCPSDNTCHCKRYD